MKKRNFKSQWITLGMGLLSAALIQSCGSGSGSSAIPVTSSVSDTVSGEVNSTLYNACTEGAEAVDEAGLGVNVIGATLTTLSNGTSVCQVQMEAQSGWLEPAGVPQLGPGTGGVENPAFTSISVGQYDMVSISAEGSFATGGFLGFNTCSTSGGFTSNELYASIPGLGVPYIELPASNLVVPETGGGNISVGVNVESDTTGCLMVSLQVNVTRCVDSSGNVWPCPNS